MVHGWLFIDKPKGLSSTAVVSRIKRLLKIKKVGHGGTLDPLASGILPIAVGEATKTVSYVMEAPKVYEFDIRWGEQRTTDDAEGDIEKTSPIRPTSDAIIAALPHFMGTILQKPPVYSAIKVGGERAYALARRDLRPTLTPRPVIIEELTLVSAAHPNTASFRIKCEKGAYVRSLARDIALRLGTYGYASSIRRTAVGRFGENEAILLDALANRNQDRLYIEGLHPITDVLDDIPAISIPAFLEKKLAQGQAVQIARDQEHGLQSQEIILCKDEADIPLAMARFDQGLAHPVRVFNIKLSNKE